MLSVPSGPVITFDLIKGDSTWTLNEIVVHGTDRKDGPITDARAKLRRGANDVRLAACFAIMKLRSSPRYQGTLAGVRGPKERELCKQLRELWHASRRSDHWTTKLLVESGRFPRLKSPDEEGEFKPPALNELFAVSGTDEDWRISANVSLDQIHLSVDRRLATVAELCEFVSKTVEIDVNLSAGADDLLADLPDPPEYFEGRDEDLSKLHAAWKAGCRVLEIVNDGGEGKTALAQRFVRNLLAEEPDRPIVVWWNFYAKRSIAQFFRVTADHLLKRTTPSDAHTPPLRNATELLELLTLGCRERPVLLVLDGFEPLQGTAAGDEGRIRDGTMRTFLQRFLDAPDSAGVHTGTVLITSRVPVTNLVSPCPNRRYRLPFKGLSEAAGVTLLRDCYELRISTRDAQLFVNAVGGNALAISLTGAFFGEVTARRAKGDSTSTHIKASATNLLRLTRFLRSISALVRHPNHTRTSTKKKRSICEMVLRHCSTALAAEEKEFVRLLSCCLRPATARVIKAVFLRPIQRENQAYVLNSSLAAMSYDDALCSAVRLKRLGLINGDEERGFDLHPLIREYFTMQERARGALMPTGVRAVNGALFNLLWIEAIEEGERARMTALGRVIGMDRIAADAPGHPDVLAEMTLDATLYGMKGHRFVETRRFHQMIGEGGIPEWYLARFVEQLGGYLPGLMELVEYVQSPLTERLLMVPDARKLLMTLAVAHVPYELAASEDGQDIAASVIACAEQIGELEAAALMLRASAIQHMYVGEPVLAKEAAERSYELLVECTRTMKWHAEAWSLTHGVIAASYAIRDLDALAEIKFGEACRTSRRDSVPPPVGYWYYLWLARRARFADALRAIEVFEVARDRTFAVSYDAAVQIARAAVQRLARSAGQAQADSTHAELVRDAQIAVETARQTHHRYFEAAALVEAAHCAVVDVYTGLRAALPAEAQDWLDVGMEHCRENGYRLLEADASVVAGHLQRLRGDLEAAQDRYETALQLATRDGWRYEWAWQDAAAALESLKRRE